MELSQPILAQVHTLKLKSLSLWGPYYFILIFGFMLDFPTKQYTDSSSSNPSPHEHTSCLTREGRSFTCQTCLSQGNVEVWLGQLLAGVRQTLHAIIRQAYLAISDPGMKLLEFQLAFPAQVGLLGIQMIWTRDAEDALVLSKSDKKVPVF